MSNIREKLFNLGNYFAGLIPTSLARPFIMPITYQTRVSDGFVYENGNMINTAFGYCSNNKIEGDYAEFGVFKGRTTIEAWRASHRHNLSNTKFWVFDSFEGLPEVKGEDENGPFVTGEFCFGRNEFENNLKKSKFDFNRMEIVEGYFDKTLPQTKTDRKFSVVWIDCDLYESTVPVLEWLTDKLVDGAVICFDDWYSFNGRPDKGEQKATSEWLEANPHIRLMPYREFHWAGKSFLFHNLNEH
jgi:O-methyltransferase